MRIVIALGGNALLRRGEPMTTEVQRRNIKVAAEAIGSLSDIAGIVAGTAGTNVIAATTPVAAEAPGSLAGR